MEISSLDGRGVTLFKRSGRIPAISPGAREALELPFPLGRSLPANFIGSITGVTWLGEPQPQSVEVTAASFLEDARTPAVRVHLLDHAGNAIQVSITVVCWDGAGNIRGGGTRALRLDPAPQGTDASVSVAVSTIPLRCDGYAVRVD